MDSKPMGREDEVLAALRALEGASRVPNLEAKDLKRILDRERWSAGCNP